MYCYLKKWDWYANFNAAVTSIVFAQDKVNKEVFSVSPVFVHRGKKLYATYGFGGGHRRAH